MRITEAAQLFLAHRRAKRLSQNSLDRYAQALQRWQRWRTAQQLVDDLAAVDAAELRDLIPIRVLVYTLHYCHSLH